MTTSLDLESPGHPPIWGPARSVWRVRHRPDLATKFGANTAIAGSLPGATTKPMLTFC